MGFGAMVKYSIVPTVINVIMGTLGALIGIIPVIGGFLVCLTGPIGWVISAVLFAWAGHSLVKGGGGGIGSAAGAGFISALASTIIVGVINLVFQMLGIGVGAALNQNSDAGTMLMGAGVGLGAGLIGGAVALVIWPIVGAVMGAIGGMVAGGPKK
ncbi:Uncharacterised protein [uncultured archaeon]|nr:Uncharacterised protein [uncultured archaeon]